MTLRPFLIIFIFNLAFLFSSAQPKLIEIQSNGIVQTKVRDTSNNPFFKINGQIDRVVIRYKDFTPHDLYLYFKHNNKTREYYELQREVDTLVWARKYGLFKYPASELLLASDSLKGSEGKKYAVLSAVLSSDSIRYHLVKANNPIYREERIALGVAAAYHGNLRQLADTLGLNYRKNYTEKDIDSTIVWNASIDEHGVLTGLELIVGKKSSFSSFIQNELEDPARKWRSARLKETAANLKTTIKIYAQLNKDGTITLLLSPKRLVNLFEK